MAIALTCPSCQSAVSATEAKRGSVVRCTICHAEVPVPGVVPRAMPAMAIPALAVPAPAAAKSVPVAARPAVASPAVAELALARPAVAAPAPKKSSRFDDEEKPRPRHRSRDDDDEYDDNEDYRDKPKKKSSGLVLWLCVLGGVFFLGAACVGLVVYRMNKMADEFAAEDQYTEEELGDGDFNDDDEEAPQPGRRPSRWPKRGNQTPSTETPVDPNPAPPTFRPGEATPPPTTTAPVRNDWEKPWKPLPRVEGFEALMPDGVASIPKSPSLHDGERILVTFHTADEAGVKYGVQWFDAPEEFPDPDEYVAIIRAKWKIESGTKPATVGTTLANQVVYSNPTTREFETTRATKVGPRIFLFTVAHNPERVAEFAGLDIASKQRQFFDSVRITANPLAKAPLSTKVKPSAPTTTVDPSVAPPLQTPGTIVPGPIPGATGGIVLVGQIERFVTGIYLAERKELWTCDAKSPAPNSSGVLRRYSGGSLKLLATVELPGPVTHAVVDEAAGKLYAAVVTRGGGFDYPERLTATAELHAYEVKAIVADAAGPLKPTAIARPEGKITGLVVAKTGKQVFATTVLQTPTKTKTRLVKFSAPSLADLNDALDLPQPVAVLRLAPEGKRMIAAQAQYNPFGNPVRGFNAQTSAFLIDVASWKIAATATMPGVATDVQFVDDARAIALVPGGGQQARLLAIDTKGSTTDITPPAPGFRAPGLAFAAMIPESERAILSAGAGSGVEVLDLAAAKARPLGHVSIVPRLLLSGAPILADREAKVVVFTSGAVLNVSAAR